MGLEKERRLNSDNPRSPARLTLHNQPENFLEFENKAGGMGGNPITPSDTRFILTHLVPLQGNI